jgi:hypothetical protein
MLRRWCLGVTVVITTVTCALPASAQQPPLPGTPPVTVPTVTVPPVTVPPVTVPPATVPTTPVTPEVTTPPVQTPTVTTPSVSTSSGAANGAGQGSASGDGQSASGQASGSGQSGSGSASGAGQQSGAGQPSATGARGGGKNGPRTSGSSSADDPGNTPRRSRDRDLRRAVLSHEACLGQMPRGERRVLTLRAGVGLAHTRSRAQVQRITGLPRTRVAALERSGLRRLRSLAQAGGCGQAASTTPGALAPPTGVSAARAIANGASIPRIGVLGERQSSASVTTAPPPSDGSSDSGRPLLHAPDSAVDLGPILLFVLLAGFVFAAVREARRSA